FIDEYERTRQITFSDTSSVVSFSGYCNKIFLIIQLAIQSQQRHNTDNSLMNTKEQDRSHLAIHHQLSRSVGTVTRNDELFFQRILPKIETMTRNLSKFENLDLFDYTTSNTVTAAA
uniref:Uncharacterized protein n=1 Tax=Wuchereria bancrofti TaxID=6293 RepID=A0AAF5Q6V8_WUCBA